MLWDKPLWFAATYIERPQLAVKRTSCGTTRYRLESSRYTHDPGCRERL